jgi:hypothetical protein
MTKRIIIPENIGNEAATRAGGKCECDNPECDHVLGECPQPANSFYAGAAFVGPVPVADAEMKQRVKWMCEGCRSKTPLPMLEQA